MRVLVTLFLIIFSVTCSPHILICHPKSKQVGIWYQTWYNKDFWSSYNIQTQPLIGQYDSSDPNVIDRHIEVLESLGVDFVILDNTNNIYVDGGYILNNSLTFCQHLKNHHLKFAVAIGGMQFDSDPKTMATEIAAINSVFILSSCGDNYMMVDGKPLIISYPSLTQSAQTLATIASAYTNVYAVKWIHGEAQAGEMGWAVPAGPVESCQAMVTMPGWQPKYGSAIDRNNGNIYKESWDRIIEIQPEFAIITSFNDFFEQTFIEDTVDLGDKYVNITREAVKRYKK